MKNRHQLGFFFALVPAMAACSESALLGKVGLCWESAEATLRCQFAQPSIRDGWLFGGLVAGMGRAKGEKSEEPEFGECHDEI